MTCRAFKGRLSTCGWSKTVTQAITVLASVTRSLRLFLSPRLGDGRNLIIILTSSRSSSDASATHNFLDLKGGGEKNKGPLLLLSLGQLTLSAMLCPDGVASLPGAEDPL